MEAGCCRPPCLAGSARRSANSRSLCKCTRAADDQSRLCVLLHKHAQAAGAGCISLCGKPISPHSIRHGCAMVLFQATGDLRKVSLWLGHANMQTTEIYLRADPMEKIRAIEGVTPPRLKPGRFTVPDKLIASLQQHKTKLGLTKTVRPVRLQKRTGKGSRTYWWFDPE